MRSVTAQLYSVRKGTKTKKRKKRSREEWTEIARKQAAARRANGTTAGRKKGWNVSERALR